MDGYIEQILAASPNEDPEKLMANIGEMIDFYKSQAKPHVNGPVEERHGLALAFHNVVDESLAKMNDQAKSMIKCKKGW